MKKDLETLYKINKAKLRIKIFDVVIIAFAILTILLIFSSTYICNGKIYERTTTNGVESVNQLLSIDSKITFSNLAFGLGEDTEELELVPVSHDTRFLFLYLAQIIAYIFMLFKLIDNMKVNFIMSIVTGIILFVVAVSTIVFMSGYSNDLQMMFDQTIAELKDINENITSVTDSSYPSRIVVEISPIPALSCAYMIISGLICIYSGFLKKGIKEMEQNK